ncbi:UvrD-helicase domain-containing protein [Zooshikella ganghwensis]|uniref:DNA 3'-5' helicase n=1 Tax=Zooshikella ganghwensis TaxID=202772 RepID=A0A4P9VP09_9GAMM|nr:UvrD-helicase domain-containing protein [Zooshikella ganghwensis]RDH44134.1 DNA helicase UvrD [Zooshikella ganghwensis]
MSQPADIKARLAALDPAQSFAVTAPAGSGKTGLLTQRVLTLLGVVEKPEEILCITFTRKAAAEMRVRILNALREAATTSCPKDPYLAQTYQLARQALQKNATMGWQLLENGNRLRIQTIDGFCAQLARQLPMLSGFGGMPDIVDSAQVLYEDAVKRLLAELNSQDVIGDNIALLLDHLDNRMDRLQGLLVSLLERRDQWLQFMVACHQDEQFQAKLEQAIYQVNCQLLLEVREKLTPYGSDLVMLADQAAQQLVSEEPDHTQVACLGMVELPKAEPSHLAQWLGLADMLLTQKGQWRKSVTKKQGFPTGKTKAEKVQFEPLKQAVSALLATLSEQPGLADALQQVRSLPPVSYAPHQWQVIKALSHVLPRLAGHLLLVFRDQGTVDHSQITEAALVALGQDLTPSDLALRLDYQIKHILVDEFQDTSSPQFALLERLVQGWTADDSRSLFIVGDGMQSCYGFRDANVGLFLRARRYGVGDVSLTPLQLTTNFRSQAGIIHWVNQVFKQAFPAQENIPLGAVQYSASAPFCPVLDERPVLCMGCEDSSRQLEAQQVTQLVQKHLDERPRETIAILVRNRSHLRTIIPSLQQAGIRWQATDIDPLASRPLILDLLSLTRALTNAADKLAWLAVLRAPWCGLNQQDLETIAQVASKTVIQSIESPDIIQRLSRDGVLRLQRVAPVLAKAYLQRQRKHLVTLVHGCWLALGGPAATLDLVTLNDLDAFWLVLDAMPSSAIKPFNHMELEEKVVKLYAQADPEGDPRVQIMTIHKAKGLEFDTVILPGLEKRGQADSSSLLLWQQRLSEDQQAASSLLMSPLHRYEDEQGDKLYEFIRQQEQQKQRLESIRVLYVACTRAKKQLYLLFSGEQNKEPSKDALLACIWPAIRHQIQWQELPVANTALASKPIKSGQFLHRLPADWTCPGLPRGQLLKAYRGEEYDDEENLPELNWDDVPRHVGTVVHRALYHITITGIEKITSQTKAYCDQRQAVWLQHLRQLGVGREDYDRALQSVRAAVTKTLQDSQALWLLDHSLEDSQCEYPITMQVRGKMLHYVVDRTFIDAAGTRWIVDYKTVEFDARTGSLDNLIQQEIAEYKSQLQNYVQTFQLMESRPTQSALYFTNISRLIKVSL